MKKLLVSIMTAFTCGFANGQEWSGQVVFGSMARQFLEHHGVSEGETNSVATFWEPPAVLFGETNPVSVFCTVQTNSSDGAESMRFGFVDGNETNAVGKAIVFQSVSDARLHLGNTLGVSSKNVLDDFRVVSTNGNGIVFAPLFYNRDAETHDPRTDKAWAVFGPVFLSVESSGRPAWTIAAELIAPTSGSNPPMAPEE